MRHYPATTGKYRLTGEYDRELAGLALKVQELVRDNRRQVDKSWVKAADAAQIDTIKRIKRRP